MNDRVQAIYEDGVLKLREPLAIAEHATVEVRIEQARPVIQGLEGLEDLIDWDAMAWAREQVGEQPVVLRLLDLLQGAESGEESMSDAVLEQRMDRWEK